MSRDDLSVASIALSVWPNPPQVDAGQTLSDACTRLLDAMSGLSTGHSAWRDLAALVRQVLVTAASTYGSSPALTVPVSQEWPTADQWRDLNCVPATWLTDASAFGQPSGSLEVWTSQRRRQSRAARYSPRFGTRTPCSLRCEPTRSGLAPTAPSSRPTVRVPASIGSCRGDE